MSGLVPGIVGTNWLHNGQTGKKIIKHKKKIYKKKSYLELEHPFLIQFDNYVLRICSDLNCNK